MRTPVQAPRGRRLRVLIYARYSTDEQRRRSIKAQVEFCTRFLEALPGVTNPDIEVISDEALSGELLSRPGIDQVHAGVQALRWDLILVEDSSRLYRDDGACVRLVGLAVDKEIRSICINDYVDTAEEGWEERLRDAARHHAARNRFTSCQIKRAHEELWGDGAALGLCKPGYMRRPSVPATKDDPAEGPFFDEVDPIWAPTIKAAYERIAAGETPWRVAHWLTKVGLPKSANSQRSEWSDKNVIALIRRTDYRGYQTYRDHVSKKEYSTGKHKPKPNAAEGILTREAPHLRIVDDWLWDAANQAIDNRMPKTEIPSGQANPQYGIPRDCRGPLSGIMQCRCEGNMVVDGRVEGGYRCSRVRRGECWNKASALQDKTHRWIGQATIQELESLDARVDRLLSDATYLLDDDGQREDRKTELRQKKAELEVTRDRLVRAVEVGQGQVESLVDRLRACETELDRVRAKLQGLDDQDHDCAPPTHREVHDRIQEMIAAFQKMDRSSRDEIKALVGTIRVIPCQQFGSHKVVLRAKYTLHLAVLLPARTRIALAGLYGVEIDDEFEQIPMVVDLFDRSAGPMHGLTALRLQEDYGLGPTAIGRELGITKRKADLAVQYGLALRQAGLTDPYIELTEPPAGASRWRDRRHQQNRTDSKSELPHSEPIPLDSSGSDSVPP